MLAVVGCSSDGGVAVGDYLAKLQAAFCKRDTACHDYPDVATCNAAFQVADDYYLTMVAAVGRKEVTYDASAASACIDEIASGGCAFTGFQVTHDSCSKVFTGTIAIGGPCSETAECVAPAVCAFSNVTCNPFTACCAGTCSAPPAVAIGAACMQSSDCVDGAYCAQSTKKCAAIATTEAAACDGFDGCANPMVCSYDVNTNTFSTCYTPAAKHATCDPTLFIPCAESDEYCDATTHTCADDLIVGAPCGGSNGAQCLGYEYCGGPNFHCVAKPAAGEACTVSGGFSNCLGSLECTNNVCTLPAQMACN